MSDASFIISMEDVMYILGFFVFLILVSLIKIGSMYYDALRKPMSYLRKEHYNMKNVRELRIKFSRFVREDERHLYL